MTQNINQNPEQIARDKIDQMLIIAGWLVQSKKDIDLGANRGVVIGGQSGKDFFAKLTISYKEARETHYWLRLLADTDYLDKKESKSL